MTLGYLDDLTLGGPIDVVAEEVQSIATAGRLLGLHLNYSKCELLAHKDTVVSDTTLLSFLRVDVGDASLLGAPLFTGNSLDTAWSDRCDELSRAIEQLRQIAAQDALMLLRASFGTPRVQHLLRASPSLENPALARFDHLLRTAVGCLTNSSMTDIQWLQASLPVRMGGLGVRGVVSLALPAYLASAAGTLQLQDAPTPYYWQRKVRRIVFLQRTWRGGGRKRLELICRWRDCLVGSRSGIALVSCATATGSRRRSRIRFNGHSIWLPRRPTAEIG